MYNPGEEDHELERLSREAADGYEVPVTANWQTMLEQLNKEMPQEKKRRFLIFWWLLPVLLLGGAVFSYYAFVKQRTAIATTPAKASVTALAKNEQAAKQTPAGDIKNSQSPITEQPAVVKTDNSKTDALATAHSHLRTGIPHGQKNNETTTTAVNTQANNVNSSVPDARVSRDQDITTNTPPLNDNQANSSIEKMESAGTPAEIKKDDPVATENKQEASTISTVKRKASKQWSIALVAGVDESTVKLRYAYDPGYNVGLIAGYHFSDKLSIHTGAIYTQKNYKMAGSDFTAPKGTWVSYYKLETVAGYCRMWEVPLLLRYTISSSAKKSFFISTGMSSYFMTAENYDYFYYYNNRPVTRNSAYKSTDTHVLSIAHLSAGFENRIGKQLYLQVEPYAKLPLGGVGFGNIQLSSFGLNFAVQRRMGGKK